MNSYLLISDELMSKNKCLYYESYLLQVFTFLVLHADEQGYYKAGTRAASREIGLYHGTVKQKIDRLVDFDFVSFTKPKSIIEVYIPEIENYRVLRKHFSN